MEKLVDKISEHLKSLLSRNDIQDVLSDEGSITYYLEKISKLEYYSLIPKSYLEFLAYNKNELSIYGVLLNSANGFWDSRLLQPSEWDEPNYKKDDDELFYDTKIYDLRINRDDYLNLYAPSRLDISITEIASLFIDLNPSEMGRKGQVVYQQLGGANGNIEFVVAKDFNELLTNYLKDLETEQYQITYSGISYIRKGDINSDMSSYFNHFVPDKYIKLIEA